MSNKGGFVLMVVIFLAAIFLTLGAILVKTVYNTAVGVSAILQRQQAFYQAEAGIEKGKVELAHNPNWYTDPPCLVSDKVSWLIHQAIGQKEKSFKVVRERGENTLYSVGYQGKGMAIIKLEFSNPPFKNLKWEEL